MKKITKIKKKNESINNEYKLKKKKKINDKKINDDKINKKMKNSIDQ